MAGKPSPDGYNQADAATQYAIEQALIIQLYRYFYAQNMVPYVPKHIIRTKSSNSSAFINKLTWIPGSHEFVDLTPAQMSQLMPQIRLYKQLYTSSGENNGEIEFEIPSKINTDILLSDTTDQGVGIKNFQYKYVGGNPATVTNDIEAKLTLYFQNFSELLRKRYSTLAGGDAALAAGSSQEYSFLDLFSRARRLKEEDCTPTSGATTTSSTGTSTPDVTLRTETDSDGKTVLTAEAAEYRDIVSRLEEPPVRDKYEPLDYEIKVVVGWAVPEGNTTLSTQQIEAIRSCQQAFFLTLIDHEFGFGQDGTFSVELNYRARLGAILDSPQLDVLRMDTIDAGKFRDLQVSDLIDDGGTTLTFVGTPAEIAKEYKQKLKAARYSCDTEAIDFLQSRLDRHTDNMRSARYKKISSYMIDNKRIYSQFVSTTTLNTWANTPYYDKNQIKQYKQYIDPFASGPTSANANPATVTGDVATGDEVKAQEAMLDATGTSYVIGVWEDEDSEARMNAWEEALSTTETTRGGAGDLPGKKIMYFLFGDLLDYLIETAKQPSEDNSDGISQEDLEKVKFLVGSAYFSGDLYSITHIPITWESFQNFWYKKVIKPRRDKYPLLQMVRDMIRELLFGTLNSKYYNSSRQFNQSFKSAFISLPRVVESSGRIRSEDPLTLASKEQGGSGQIIDLDGYDLENPLTPLRADVLGRDMFHYMCLFVDSGTKGHFARQAMRDAGYQGRRRDYNRDKLNIHSFGFGEDTGIFKKADFAKTDQPYLRESRYLERGGDPYIQLSNVYNATIKLFGAPFFYPGQYVWVTPYGLSKSKNTAYRLGEPDAGPTDPNCHTGRSFANLMGLGGYHIIINVEGIIEDGLYEVTLNARYDNSGADLGDRVGFGENNEKRCQDEGDPTFNP